MREIKFRAWDGTKIIKSDDWPNLSGFFGTRSPSETLMQFTGLKDKNGKEIYEGDIVRCTDKRDGESVLTVRWVQERAAFRYVDAECNEREWVSEIDMFDNGEEVIGNIYENEDLLANKDL